MATSSRNLALRHRRYKESRGAIVVLSALLMVFMLGMLAFAIDVGYMMSAKTDLQRSVDSAVFAGAGEMINGTTEAEAEARDYLSKNKVGGKTLTNAQATVEFGTWNTTSRTFTVSASSPTAIRVTATSNQQPMFFGKVFGLSQFSVTAKAVAVYQPRDIVMTLDYSGSMAFDSQFRNVYLLGQSAVEANIAKIYADLGSPTYGKLKYTPEYYDDDNSKSKILEKFGLDKVSYPYPGGSWSDYIDYVQDDDYVDAAGYEDRYGYLTWVSYLQSQQGSYADTPDLWKTREQPLTALKDAVDVFLDYLDDHSTDDRVGVSIYSASDGTAKLEQGLTKTYTLVSTPVRQRQAGHYTGGTNISAGMNKGRVELQTNGRSGALKMMVVMTDGQVNLPSGNTTSDKAAVITEANACKTAKIPCVCISLGALADTDLMQQVADITGGAAFIVPGGQSIEDVQEQLEEVFAQVAADRPLKLVQ